MEALGKFIKVDSQSCGMSSKSPQPKPVPMGDTYIVHDIYYHPQPYCQGDGHFLSSDERDAPGTDVKWQLQVDGKPTSVYVWTHGDSE